MDDHQVFVFEAGLNEVGQQTPDLGRESRLPLFYFFVGYAGLLPSIVQV
jgi:hypothetical protein